MYYARRGRHIGHTRQTLRTLLLATLSAAALAGCDHAATSPDRQTRSVQTKAPRFDLSDTLNCISGYVIIDGEVVCD